MKDVSKQTVEKQKSRKQKSFLNSRDRDTIKIFSQGTIASIILIYVVRADPDFLGQNNFIILLLFLGFGVALSILSIKSKKVEEKHKTLGIIFLSLIIIFFTGFLFGSPALIGLAELPMSFFGIWLSCSLIRMINNQEKKNNMNVLNKFKS